MCKQAETHLPMCIDIQNGRRSFRQVAVSHYFVDPVLRVACIYVSIHLPLVFSLSWPRANPTPCSCVIWPDSTRRPYSPYIPSAYTTLNRQIAAHSGQEILDDAAWAGQSGRASPDMVPAGQRYRRSEFCSFYRHTICRSISSFSKTSHKINSTLRPLHFHRQ